METTLRGWKGDRTGAAATDTSLMAAPDNFFRFFQRVSRPSTAYRKDIIRMVEFDG